MKWKVYFLKSKWKPNWVYVGSTNNLERRLNEHNKGKVSATKAFTPLYVVYFEGYDEEKSARLRERYFKGWKGRIEKKDILQKLL